METNNKWNPLGKTYICTFLEFCYSGKCYRNVKGCLCSCALWFNVQREICKCTIRTTQEAASISIQTDTLSNANIHAATLKSAMIDIKLLYIHRVGGAFVINIYRLFSVLNLKNGHWLISERDRLCTIYSNAQSPNIPISSTPHYLHPPALAHGGGTCLSVNVPLRAPQHQYLCILLASAQTNR